MTDLVNQLTRLDAQRQAVVMQIRRLTDGLLTGGSAPAVAIAAATSNRKGGRPKGFKMTEATKAKLRAAWLRRKAASGGGSASASPKAAKSSGGKKKKVMSAEAREKIAAAQRKRWAAYRSGKK